MVFRKDGEFLEYLFVFETLIFATLRISYMHEQLVTLTKENLIISYAPLNETVWYHVGLYQLYITHCSLKY